MLTEHLPRPVGARRFYLIIGALIIVAWGLLIAWQDSPYSELLGHEALGDHQIPFANRLSAFLLSWLLMTVAMMLPVSLPLLIQTQRSRMKESWSNGQVVVGYLIPWVLFGFLAFLGDSVLHEMTEEGAPLAVASDFIAPAIILAAGIYQLTPFKHNFTERCKPSRDSGLAIHDLKLGDAIKHGFRSGLNCVGSCWSLMLLMFALGHHRPDWMIVLSGIVAAERYFSWGAHLAQWVGGGLIAWGIFSVIAII